MSRILSVFRNSNLFGHWQFGQKIFKKCSHNSIPLSNNPTYMTAEGLNKFVTGNVIHGFIVDEKVKVDELYLTMVRLTHLGSKSQYLHLARDDSNNVFSIGFRTTPKDSTGLPHILEHLSLCGSEKYPCRDPFFKMLRRSLATFMNAMTGSDFTIYPFSTQNLKDYRNLQSVYLDSVFKPSLRLLDFKQEGWRLEHQDVNDKNSPIIFKGVVFNEMKGVFNENQNILVHRVLNSILPSHTYSVISGGDPLVIPTLSYMDLVHFHLTYYHPSNCRFYSYGNFPLEDHLKFINDQYLLEMDHIDTEISEVPQEKRWDEPRREHITCRPDPMVADSNRQGTICISFLCNDILDTQKTFEMNVLSALLLKGPNSPFYKSLIESKVGIAFGRITGYDSDCRDTLFAVNLLGVRENDFLNVEKIFNETVKMVVETGFENDRIEAVLHSIELQVKHQTSDFGLQLLYNLTPLFNHNGNLVSALRINNAVQKLKQNMKNNSKYLQNLVKKYLMENKHMLIMTMLPDDLYDQQKMVAEQELLESKLKQLSQEELDQIYVDGKILQEEQQKKEDVNVLPTLMMEDIKPDVDRYKLIDAQIACVPLQISVEPTNGVCYYRGILNVQRLSPELKILLPLFNNVISRMGTKSYDYRQFDQMIQLKTGGLNFSNLVAEHKSNVFQYEEGIFIGSFCLNRNVPDMWKLWQELFGNVELSDRERFETLVQATAADLVNGIADSGHIYAMSSAASLVSPISKHKESLSGLQYVYRMKKIAQMQDLSLILNQMKEIADEVLNKQYLRSAITMSQYWTEKDKILEGMGEFYSSLKNSYENSYIFTSDENNETQDSAVHYILPYTVNYTSKAVLTVPYMDPDYAPLQVLSKLISSIYLHPEIREKGGAYGGGARMSGEGVFMFYSYRDPNSTRTLDLYDGTYNFLLNYSLPESEIDEAKLGVFQRLDAPLSPCERGMLKFTHNITDDDIQEQRMQVKAVTKDQLIYVAEKYLQPERKGVRVGRALIGPMNDEILNRNSEHWVLQNQEEEAQARVAE